MGHGRKDSGYIEKAYHFHGLEKSSKKLSLIPRGHKDLYKVI